MTQPQIPRLSAFRKTGYGSGSAAYSLSYQVVNASYMLFATVILGIPPVWAGGIIAVSTFWDAITDPLMGYISDNSSSQKYGRRHQYLLIGMILIALFNGLLWSIDPGLSLSTKSILLFFLVIATKTAFTVYITPYNALGAELSNDYDQRSSIQSYRAVFYIIGMIAAIVGANAIFFRSTPAFPQGQLNPAAYPAMGYWFSVFVLIMGSIAYFATRKYIPYLPQRSTSMRAHKPGIKSIFADLKSAAKNKDFVAIVANIFIIEVGFQLGIAVGFHVNTYTYHLTGPIMALLGLIVLGTSILSQPLWVWVTRKLEKRTALIIGLIIGFIGFVGGAWTHVWWKIFPLDLATLPYTLGIWGILAGLGNGAFMSIPYSMVADSADEEELISGKRDEGLYYGVYTFAYKLGSSISLVAAGFLLKAIGFDAQLSEQTAATQYDLAMVPSFMLIAISPLAFYFLRNYSITRARQKEIRQELEQREA